jgi:hypothetical protein
MRWQNKLSTQPTPPLARLTAGPTAARHTGARPPPQARAALVPPPPSRCLWGRPAKDHPAGSPRRRRPKHAEGDGVQSVKDSPTDHAEHLLCTRPRHRDRVTAPAHSEASLRQGIQRGFLTGPVLVVAAWVAVWGRRVGRGSGSGLSEEPALGV